MKAIIKSLMMVVSPFDTLCTVEREGKMLSPPIKKRFFSLGCLRHSDVKKVHLFIATPLSAALSNCCAMALWWALFLLLVNDATCLAVNNAPITRIVSTKKDGGLSKTFTFDGTQQHLDHSSRTHANLNLSMKQIQAGLRSTFLPSGYPTKTPPGYLSYSMWSWIQDTSTQLRSVLATQRVLEGVGVGREGATALSALMNFLVRDGCGMAATLMFTSVASSRFKTDVKRWRLFADIMVDLGITLEVAATMVPKCLFLPMICKYNPDFSLLTSHFLICIFSWV